MLVNKQAPAGQIVDDAGKPTGASIFTEEMKDQKADDRWQKFMQKLVDPFFWDPKASGRQGTTEKHLPGKHNQKTHGRRTASASTAGDRSAPAAAPAKAGGTSAAAPAQALHPAGSPLSSHLQIASKDPTLKDDMTRVVEVIDKIHGDGSLGTIPLKQSPNLTGGTLGDFTSMGRQAEKIRIKSGIQNESRLCIAHEIGHFIDHQGGNQYDPAPFALSNAVLAGKNRKKYPPEVQKAMGELQTAFQGSGTVQTLHSIASSGQLTLKNGVTIKADNKYSQYLLDRKEVWARAYSQYIATKCQRGGLSKTMRKELAAQQKQQAKHGGYPKYWEDADFAPIEKGMDALFSALGWSQ